MATTIVTKKGSGAPAASDLVEGELAVDTTNGRLYTENSSAAVVELGSNPSGNITFGDSGKAIFGAGSDLQIYHDGSASRIVDAGTGSLKIQAENFAVNNVADTENMITAVPDGAVSLFYDGAAKLATTSTGIDVTGNIINSGHFLHNNNSGLKIIGGGDATNDGSNLTLYGSTNASAGTFRFRNGTATHLEVAGNGDISFYEDTGTTAKLFWDASAESLTFGSNLAITSNEIDVSSGDLTLDVAGGIILDAATGVISLHEAGNGVFGTLTRASGSLAIKSEVSDADIIFKGNDGGSAITALTLDMSAAGAATFSSSVQTGGLVDVRTSHTSTDVTAANSNTTLRLLNSGSGNGIYNAIKFSGNQQDMYIMSFNNATQADRRLGFFVGSTAGDAATDERLSITGDGNVSIGNTAAATRLHVKSSGGVGTSSTFETDAPSSAINFVNTGSSTNAYLGSVGTSLFFATNDTERARLTNDGNFLVGKTALDNSTVGARINATGDASFVADGNRPLVLNRKTSDGELLVMLKDNAHIGSLSTKSDDLVIHSQTTNHTGLSFSDGSILPTNNYGTTSTNTVDLGSSSRKFKNLYLSGGVYANNASGAFLWNAEDAHIAFGTNDLERMRIDSAGVTTFTKSGGGNIRIAETASRYVEIMGYAEGTANGSTMAFHTIQSGTSTSTERARLTSDGNLLVGATSGSNHVIQKSAASAIALNINNSSATSPRGASFTFSAATPNDGTATFFTASDSTAYRGGWLSNGGIQNYQSNDSNLSDRREKTNFAPAKNYLKTICAIPVQTFNYIDQNMEDDDSPSLGVVAQDVQAVAPELVVESDWGTEHESKMRLSIYQTDFQFALMKCIQEQQTLIESLTARIAALES